MLPTFCRRGGLSLNVRLFLHCLADCAFLNMGCDTDTCNSCMDCVQDPGSDHMIKCVFLPSGNQTWINYYIKIIYKSTWIFKITLFSLARATGSLAGGLLVAVAGCALINRKIIIYKWLMFNILVCLPDGRTKPSWTWSQAQSKRKESQTQTPSYQIICKEYRNSFF